jgi:hypothetical protein
MSDWGDADDKNTMLIAKVMADGSVKQVTSDAAKALLPPVPGVRVAKNNHLKRYYGYHPLAPHVGITKTRSWGWESSGRQSAASPEDALEKCINGLHEIQELLNNAPEPSASSSSSAAAAPPAPAAPVKGRARGRGRGRGRNRDSYFK